ncbi:MAG TPA: YceI family protein [Steroidobacteraceae bacterium]|nr:YceI family protein [Steroidobacteraceae bacterium]
MRHATLTPALAATLLACGALGCAQAGEAAAGSQYAVSHYTLDPAKSSLEFTFLQAGAKNSGRFPRFAVTLDCAGADPAGGRLEVTVEVAALDTGDKDRDDTLRSADLFAVAKFPQAHFLATRIVRTTAGYEAEGALTIRGVTRAAKVPFTFREATEGGAVVGYLTGKTLVRRLDFGVGQGEWQATDQAGNEVTVSFALRLTRAH